MFSTVDRLDRETNPLLYLDYKYSTWSWDLIPLAVLFMYLAFVLRIGPKLMAKREPFNIKNIIILYNLFQVVCNILICDKIIRYVIDNVKFNELYCIREERNDSPLVIDTKEIEFVYFLNKVADLLDSVFFILRKKHSHVNFFHVYHHTAIFLTSWVGFRCVNGGIYIGYGILNTSVHSIMYAYYLLSVNSQTSKISNLMKKPLTWLQIVQFVLLGTTAILCLMNLNCEEVSPAQRIFRYMALIQSIIMLYLFIKFYLKTYRKKIKN